MIKECQIDERVKDVSLISACMSVHGIHWFQAINGDSVCLLIPSNDKIPSFVVNN